MQNIYKVTKYLFDVFKAQTFICFLIILFNIALAVTGRFIFGLDSEGEIRIGSTDMVGFIFLLVIGIVFIKPTFQFIIANGVSRSSYFKALVLTIVSVSLLWAVGLALLSVWSRRYVQINVLYELMYQNLNLFSAFIWMFAVLFWMAILGLFITLLYYRSSRALKYVITFGPFVLSGLLTLINFAVGGALFGAVGRFLIASLGYSTSGAVTTANPYVGALSFTIFAVLLLGFIYLLLRRAPIQA